MKTLISIIMCLSLTGLHAVEPLLADLLRQGLFEEEANQNPEKAAVHYREVIAAHERQRALAASAYFRLGEIFRKKNQKEAAIENYRIVIERFPEQKELARISRENLIALGAEAVPQTTTSNAVENQDSELLKSIMGKSWKNEKGRILNLLPDGMVMLVNRTNDGTDPKHKYEILNGDIKGIRIHWWNGDSPYEVKDYVFLDGVNIIKNIRNDSDFWYIQKTTD